MSQTPRFPNPLRPLAVVVAVICSLSIATPATASSQSSEQPRAAHESGAGEAIDSLAQSITKWFTRVDRSVKPSYLTVPKSVGSLPKSIAKLKAVSNPTPLQRAALRQAIQLKSWRSMAAKVAQLAENDQEGFASTSASVVRESVASRPTKQVESTLEDIGLETLKSTVCSLVEEGLSPEEERGLSGHKENGELVYRLTYNPESAIVPDTQQSIDDAFEHVDSLLFARGIYIQSVGVRFDRIKFLNETFGKAKDMWSAVKGVAQSTDPLTTREWVYYVQYCVVR